MTAAGTADATGLLARLVAFDTTSAKSNRALIDFVTEYLSAHGVLSHRVDSAAGDKASLFATIGPSVAGGVVLSGHTDVVPIADQAWSSDPFVLAERDDLLYARGACDMKGFIACTLAVVPEFCRSELRVPLHLALSYDEEVGCLAAPELITRLIAAVPRPAFAIVGEPSEMRVATAHRGITTFAATVIGRTGHSSDPAAGVNAIAAASACIAELGRLADDLAAEPGWPARGGDGMGLPERTTVNVGRIEGGSAVNVIPGRCRFLWECRPRDESDAETIRTRFAAWTEKTLLPPLRRRAPEAAVVTERKVAVPPLVARPGSPAEAVVLALTGQNRAGTVPFASEAGLFQKAGIPAVVLGPGSWAQAHQPDEFLARDQVDACLAFLRRLAAWAASEA